MESVLAQVSRKERQRLKIVPVDVGEREDVAGHFQVTSVPTLVLVREKRVVARLEGRSSATQIESLLDAHLAEPAVPA
jgi:thioredoxin-like negative regulator of GroEL